MSLPLSPLSPLSPLTSSLTLLSLLSLSSLSSLLSPSAHAQSCDDGEVSFAWTQPPRIPIEDDNSIRWPVEGGLRAAFTGDWCPSEDQVSLVDVEGQEIPSLVSVVAAESLVQNGPIAPALLMVKPLMSLAERTDYTLTLEPPNPALREFGSYAVSFKTNRDALGDLEAFEGLNEVTLGAPCAEGTYVDIDAEDFECVIPAHFNLTLSFKPLPHPEATYVLYRTSVTPFDEGGAPLREDADNTPRIVGFVAGVTADQAVRSIKAKVSTLYAPLPREECYRVEVWDDWGRPRAGVAEERCVQLTKPLACPEGCDPEAGSCTFIFPTPEPFAANEPIAGPECDNVGVHGASGRAPIPSLNEGEMEEEPEEPAPSTGDEGGCDQRGQGAQGSPFSLFALLLLCLSALITRRAHASNSSR